VEAPLTKPTLSAGLEPEDGGAMPASQFSRMTAAFGAQVR
jgi:hypothetical protein